MNEKKRPLQKWEELYVRFIFGVLVAIFFYRAMSEWIIPHIIHASKYQPSIIWATTVVLTILLSEILRRLLAK